MDTQEVNYGREARILSDQAELLIKSLGTIAGRTEEFVTGSVEFQLLANAYERLASAQRNTDARRWEGTVVDGRSGSELMQRIWELRELLRRDKAGTPNWRMHFALRADLRKVSTL